MIEIFIALLLLAGGFAMAEYGDLPAILLQTIGMLLLLHGVPSYVNAIVSRKFPMFGALVKGDEPYDKMSALPKRVAIVGIYAVILVVFVMVVVVGMYYGVATIK